MKFILSTDSSQIDDRERDLITAFLEGKGWSVWHWFKDLWLVDGAPDHMSFIDIRRELQDILPTKRRMMILTPEGKLNHAGWVQVAASPWLQEHWNAAVESPPSVNEAE